MKRMGDPELLDAAAWLGRATDFLVMPCNSAHVGLAQLAEAAGCPVLSMIDATLDEVARRRWPRVGVLGFGGAPLLYLDPLRQRGVRGETIDARMQDALDGAIRAVMEGREGDGGARAARAAVGALRAAGAAGVVLGCTEIPLLLGDDGAAPDLVNPAAVLAEAAVRRAIGGPAPDAEALP